MTEWLSELVSFNKDSLCGCVVLVSLLNLLLNWNLAVSIVNLKRYGYMTVMTGVHRSLANQPTIHHFNKAHKSVQIIWLIVSDCFTLALNRIKWELNLSLALPSKTTSTVTSHQSWVISHESSRDLIQFNNSIQFFSRGIKTHDWLMKMNLNILLMSWKLEYNTMLSVQFNPITHRAVRVTMALTSRLLPLPGGIVL